MKNFLTFTLSLILVLCLTACSSDNLSKQDTKSTNEKTSSSNQKNTDAEQDKSTHKNKESIKPDIKDDKLSDELTRDYSKIVRDKLFADDLHFDDSFEIVFEGYDDFDNDDIIEVVIALKNPNSDSLVSQIVYLKFLDDDKVELLDQFDVSQLMNITQVSLISVKGIENKVICINYSEGQQSKVFSLYELKENHIMLSFTAYTRGEIGETSLVDSDNNQGIKGYKAESYGLNNYYYYLYEDIKFFVNPYLGAETIAASVDIGDYPDNPKDVILEYLYLADIKNSVRDNDSTLVPVKNLDERINELAEFSYIDTQEYSYDSDLLKNTVIGIEPKLDFDIEIINNKATAKAKIVGEISDDDGVYVDKLINYQLEYNNKTDKWVIKEQKIMPYEPQMTESLNNPENEKTDENKYAKRLIWGDKDFEYRKYSLEKDGEYMGEVSLYNKLIYEDNSYVAVHTYQLYDVDEDNKAQNLSDERKFDWYFVEFFDGQHQYTELGGLVYIMTESGFNDFMRTGEVVESDDMQLVACDYPVKDTLKESQKGWHHYIDINSDGKDNNVKINYHAYNNMVQTGYYENFVWERGLGLICHESGYGAEKDVIKLKYLPYNEYPPEYYAKTNKFDSGNSNPVYLDFKGNYTEHKYTLSFTDGERSERRDVNLVTSLLFDSDSSKACHIYIEFNEDLRKDFPKIDWYVIEKDAEVFRFANEEDYLAYEDYLYGTGTKQVRTLYVGGENLVQLGSKEEGYMIDGRKREGMGYAMVYAHSYEHAGIKFDRNDTTEEFIWQPGKGLIGYNYQEYFDDGEIITMNLIAGDN